MRTPAQVAQDCMDAYSSDRYRSWKTVARELMKHFDDQQTEAIMRSKWTRWAADVSAHRYAYGKFPANVVVKFALKQGMDEVRKLTEETIING